MESINGLCKAVHDNLSINSSDQSSSVSVSSADTMLSNISSLSDLPIRKTADADPGLLAGL